MMQINTPCIYINKIFYTWKVNRRIRKSLSKTEAFASTTNWHYNQRTLYVISVDRFVLK